MSTLLTMSVTGGMMILVIVLLRLLLQNRLHRTVLLVLWLLAALRLLVPAFAASPISIYNLLPTREAPAAVQIEVQPAPFVPSEADVPETYVPAVNVPAADVPAASAPQAELSGMQILGLVWLIGAVLCLAFFIGIHVRSLRQYRFAIPEEEPPTAPLGRVRLKRLDTIQGPLVYGLLHPTILLPSDFPPKDSPEYEHILLHELRHVRNGDLWSKRLLLLVTCIHWFNPLVWVMLYLAAQDQEMRCDAQVIAKLGSKKAYATTLVQAETRHLTRLVETCFAFSATGSRLKAIAKAKLRPARSILIGILAAALLISCLGTVRFTAEAAESAVEEPATEEIAADRVEEATFVPQTEEAAAKPTEPTEPPVKEVLDPIPKPTQRTGVEVDETEPVEPTTYYNEIEPPMPDAWVNTPAYSGTGGPPELPTINVPDPNYGFPVISIEPTYNSGTGTIELPGVEWPGNP